MKKTSILTHPFAGNFGGMLQAYSLYNSLQSLGLECGLLDYSHNKTGLKLFLIAKTLIKYIIYHLPFFSALYASLYFRLSLDFSTIQSIKRLCHSTTIAKDVHNTFIVGSDQVWRNSMIRHIKPARFFFLDFITSEERKRSISYAASFGSNEWEGTPEETEICGRLLREFKAVSVREHSGVQICKEVFGVNAVQMPDPTLLMYVDDYAKIINSEKTWLPNRKYVAAYVLDETAGKSKLLLESAQTLNLQLQHLMPHADAKKRRDRFPISVPQWLRLIRDCEYFITDSFHGCVFAIIYNKPFACLGNEARGNARFDTLLGTFGLEDRLIGNATPEKLLQVLNAPIDWERVNAIHDGERERGINFLKENLTES